MKDQTENFVLTLIYLHRVDDVLVILKIMWKNKFLWYSFFCGNIISNLEKYF